MKAIIYTNKYELVDYEESHENSLIIHLPEKNIGKVLVLKNGIQAIVSNVQNWRIFLSYNDVEIFQGKTDLDSFIPMIDIINYYSFLDKKELEEIVNNIQLEKIKGLKKVIDELTEKKNFMKKEINLILSEFESLIENTKLNSINIRNKFSL